MRLFGKVAIGIEIDDFEIRAVELQKKNGEIYLLGYDRILLPRGTVRNGMISEAEDLTVCLKKLWTRNKFTKKNIIVGLLNRDLMTRKISLPNLPKEKLDLVISNHAQDHIPFSLENSVLDYMIVEEIKREDKKSVEVLLAVASLSMVEDFYQCFNQMGLWIKDIKLSSLALLDVIKDESVGEVKVLLDISNNSGSLVICVDGYPKLTRQLSVNFNEATGLNPINTSDKMELIEIVLSTWTQMIYSEIRSSIQYFQIHEEVNNIDEIVLSGCGSRIWGLDVELEKRLGIPVKYIDPMKNIKFKREDSRRGQIIDYTACIGLALAGLE